MKEINLNRLIKKLEEKRKNPPIFIHVLMNDGYDIALKEIIDHLKTYQD